MIDCNRLLIVESVTRKRSSRRLRMPKRLARLCIHRAPGTTHGGVTCRGPAATNTKRPRSVRSQATDGPARGFSPEAIARADSPACVANASMLTATGSHRSFGFADAAVASTRPRSSLTADGRS